MFDYIIYCFRHFLHNYIIITIKKILFYFIGIIPVYHNRKILTIHNFVKTKIISSYNNKKPRIIDDNLYKNIGLLINLFEKNNIKYWCHSGTLLGVIRHNSILPHDNDIDISVMDDQVDKIIKLNSIQNLICFYVDKKHNANNRIECGFKNIDIFIMKKCYNIITFNKTPLNWINCYFYPSEIEELIMLPFGNIKIACPSHYKPYLKRYFGQKYMTNICFKLDHMANLNLKYNNFYDILIRRYHRYGYTSGILTLNYLQ